MMMKHKILAKYPNSKFETKKLDFFYIADFSERTQKKREVEFLDNPPFDPNEPSKQMPCLVVENSNAVSIDCNVFDDSQFVGGKNQLKHGECCFFPSKNDDETWFSVVEIKDCKVKNISNYNKDIREKMDSMFQIFRNEVLITNKIYFIISFPRKKTALNDAIFTDYVRLKRYGKFFPLVTNRVVITDTHNIDVKQTLE